MTSSSSAITRFERASAELAAATLARLDRVGRAAGGDGLPAVAEQLIQDTVGEAGRGPGDLASPLANHLLPGRVGVEVSWSQGSAANLRVDLQPYATTLDGHSRRTRAQHWLATSDAWRPADASSRIGHALARVDGSLARSPRYGAFLGLEVGRAARLTAAKVYLELDPLADLRTEPLGRSIGQAFAIPFATAPLFASVATDGWHTQHRVYLVATEPVDRADLERYLGSLDLGSTIGSQVLARWTCRGHTVPADSLVVGLRATAAGIEVSLDLMLTHLASPVAAGLVGETGRLVGAGDGLTSWIAALGPGAPTYSAVRLRLRPRCTPTLSVYAPLWPEAAVGVRGFA